MKCVLYNLFTQEITFGGKLEKAHMFTTIP